MAEALLEHLSARTATAVSAGSHPKPLHANAVRVMREHGIDLTGQRSKHFDEFAGRRFDYVVSLCDRVREACPEFPGHPGLIHWSVPDPAHAGNTDRQTYPAFQRTATEINERVAFLLERINQSDPSAPPRASSLRSQRRSA